MNYENFVWKKLPTIGKGPSPRAFSSATLYTNNRLLIFGGLENETHRAMNDSYLLQLGIVLTNDLNIK